MRTLADLWDRCPPPAALDTGGPVAAAVDVLPGAAGIEFAIATMDTAQRVAVFVDVAPAPALQDVLQLLVDRDPAMVLLGLGVSPDEWRIPAPVKRCGSHQTHRWLPAFERLLARRKLAHDADTPPTKSGLWAACWLWRNRNR